MKPFQPCASPARDVVHVNHPFVQAFEQGLGEEEPIRVNYESHHRKSFQHIEEAITTAHALAFAGREQYIAQPSLVSFIISFPVRLQAMLQGQLHLKIPEKSQQRKNTCIELKKIKGIQLDYCFICLERLTVLRN